MKIKNNLLNFKDKIIYQNSDWFMFSLDSVLLANFVNIRPSDKKILDLATGNAPIPMLLTYRTKAKIYGVELQKVIYDLGLESIKENKFDNQIELINLDVKKIVDIYDSDSFDVITCNPPFFKTTSKEHLNDCDIKTIARHELMLDLDSLFLVVKKVLKNKGVFAMVHRPERFVEIIDKMREFNLEPKRVQFVYPKENKESNILLIEGVKNGNPGMKILPPLFVHNEDGSYTPIIKNMFGE